MAKVISPVTCPESAGRREAVRPPSRGLRRTGPVHPESSADFIARGGRIPAPMQSLKN